MHIRKIFTEPPINACQRFIKLYAQATSEHLQASLLADFGNPCNRVWQKIIPDKRGKALTKPTTLKDDEKSCKARMQKRLPVFFFRKAFLRLWGLQPKMPKMYYDAFRNMP